MAGVRRRNSRRKPKVNTTKPGQKAKKNRRKTVPQMEIVKERWDLSKSVRQNLEDLGLAFDPNVAIPIPKQITGVSVGGETPVQPQESVVKSASIIPELEALAKQPHGAETDKVFTLMSRSDAKFLATMISTYNEDYEKMSRDKLNHKQLTSGQLKRKCQQFLKSKYFQEAQELNI
ncbi:hypothetical protein EMCRGX_G026165 [Ephydatia muelleri]|eukprot:Em0021g906a